MRFANPEVLHFLWFFPILWFVITIIQKRMKSRLEIVFGKKTLVFLTQSVSSSKRQWKSLLTLFAICSFIIALARPQSGESLQEIRSEGVELFILLDVSESMLADDLKPNRLDQAKSELSRLLEMMPGNKTGLILFAGSAAVVSPLTNDPGALKMYIESASTNSVSSQGTEFEGALKAAKEAFEKGGITQDERTKSTRVILIVSDGEDHEPGALEAAKSLAQTGIRVITIAYGTEKGASIPVRDRMGYLQGYKKDRQGELIVSQVKGDFLRQLAQMGQGVFYFSQFGGNHLKSIVETINGYEKAQFETKLATKYEDRFQIFIILGLIIAFLEHYLGERRKHFQLWKGRFEVPPA